MILYDVILFIVTFLVGLHKPHHFRRFFGKIPDPKGREVIWIHAVSLGETKAVQPLFFSLRASYPDAFFLITTTTATGQAEARRSLSTADAFAYLPLDFRWIVNLWVKKLNPKLFLLVETDFWPNLLSALKKNGTKTAIVSAKLSALSAKRFSFFRPFSKRLFKMLDLVSAQNEEHRNRFLLFMEESRIQIGGNLKLDSFKKTVDIDFWQKRLAILEPAITLSCTHAPEEEMLLDLLPLDQIFLFLAPRHPERFNEVARILERKNIPFFRWTRLDERRGGERVLLIDTMGQLSVCYSLSRLAIVAGSFLPQVGGHNILEPCFYGVPVLFGPHMFAQEELVHRVLSARAGTQVTYASIKQSVENFFKNSSLEEAMRTAALALTQSVGGASERTAHILRAILQKV